MIKSGLICAGTQGARDDFPRKRFGGDEYKVRLRKISVGREQHEQGQTTVPGTERMPVAGM